ncbi:hypothetical protein [Microcoleus sp. herbarium5]|uniref:hypothetical protein n=1 Tax=Microcoleus sp. herbarium5 TaxID=3055434 RepID=UPI002FD5F6C1
MQVAFDALQAAVIPIDKFLALRSNQREATVSLSAKYLTKQKSGGAAVTSTSQANPTLYSLKEAKRVSFLGLVQSLTG